jgi:hypothetical protein
MTPVMTPHGIVTTLAEIAKELEDKRDEVAQLDLDFVEKRASYKRAYARVYLTTEGSVETKKQTAELHTAQESLEMELAEQVLRAGRESMRVLRDRLEIGRSLSAIMRMEWSGSA